MTAPNVKPKQREAVEPSARDPIAEWLAVFGRTLAVPKTEAREILDELEDHLRTRVDDLLIGGLSEPEATRRAVGELGETVALAKGFREARTHRRRRLVMQLVTISAAAAAITISAWTALSPAGGAATNGLSGAAGGTGTAGLVATDGDAAGGVFAAEDEREVRLDRFRVTGPTLAEAFDQLGEELNARVIVRWRDVSTQRGQSDRGSEIETFDADGMTLGEVIERLLPGTHEPTYRLTAGTLEVATTAFFDARERTLREYSMSGVALVGMGITWDDVMDSIVSLVEPDGWMLNGGTWSIDRLGPMLMVDAPPRAHAGVERMLSRLRAESDRYNKGLREQWAAEQREREAQQAEQEAAFDRAQARDRARAAEQREREARERRDQIARLRERMDELRDQEAMLRLDEGRLALQWQDGSSDLTKEQLQDIQVRQMILSTELDDVRAFRNAVRERLIELELAGD
ncbi:MAG: permease prefix domain 1-containing protein [Planctomycetota bacterium]